MEAALKNRIKQFVIDGEAAVLGVDGVADFDALASMTPRCGSTPSTSWRSTATILRGLPLHLRETSLDALREPAAGAYCPTKESFDPEIRMIW